MNPQELKHIAVLQAMDDDALTRLAAALEEKDYADGVTVFAEAWKSVLLVSRFWGL